MRGTKERKLIEALEPLACDNGFELVDVELSGSGGNRILRVFIDKEGGLSIDDIAEANRWIDEVVEDQDPISGPFTLEVSSPGIDRPLRTLEHFARFIGEQAKLSTDGIDGRANWTGTLGGVDGDSVLLDIDGETYMLPFEKIKKAHVKARIDWKDR